MELGAESFILLKELAKHSLSFDYLLVTSSHGLESIDEFLSTLKMEGSLILVCLPEKPMSFTSSQLVSFDRKIISSLILGKKGMTEMLDFAHAHSIYPIVEKFAFHMVNEAIAKVRNGSMRYRAVLTT